MCRHINFYVKKTRGSVSSKIYASVLNKLAVVSAGNYIYIYSWMCILYTYV